MSSPSVCRNCLRVARHKTLQAQYTHSQRQTYFSKSAASPPPSTTSPSTDQIVDPTAILSTPTWSIRSLLSSSPSDQPEEQPQISHSQISHLLRLSALPTPSSLAELQNIISTLQSQLLFVKEIQKVDTTGVAPLSAIRDESAAGLRESTITLDTLSQALSEEESFGHCKRPRRKRTPAALGGDTASENREDWDVLATASERAGRYFVVRSRKAKGD